MPAADARRLHAARGGEVGGAEAHAVHARRRSCDLGHVLHALRGLQDGVDEDRLFHAVLRFELRQQLVDVVDVPRALDLGQHHHVELVADRRDDFGEVVEEPGRIERVHPRPQARRAEIILPRHGDEAEAGRELGVRGDRVLEVSQDDVHLRDQIRHLGADLLDVGRHEMDHPLQPDGKLTKRLRRADGEGLVEAAGALHRRSPCLTEPT